VTCGALTSQDKARELSFNGFQAPQQGAPERSASGLAEEEADIAFGRFNDERFGMYNDEMNEESDKRRQAGSAMLDMAAGA